MKTTVKQMKSNDVEVVTSKLQTVEEMITKGFTTKSSQIRFLISEGYSVLQIYKHLKQHYPKLIYQHVRNVSVTQLKRK